MVIVVLEETSLKRCLQDSELGDVIHMHQKPIKNYLKVGPYIAHLVDIIC